MCQLCETKGCSQSYGQKLSKNRECVGINKAYLFKHKHHIFTSGIVLMDKQELESPLYQRVYRYLTMGHIDSNGTQENCLQVIVK